eukprot:gb/GECG01007256.1/.p1 GENE.gb/GECG01007256.1/~~gb/GECG01007256.1/.p1  ORF type:complete len:1097 (+),score=113.33 gb/GECG01007256.1/:1-3291(+)
MVRLSGSKGQTKQSKEANGGGGLGAKNPTKEAISISQGLCTCLTELSRALQVNTKYEEDNRALPRAATTESLSADARGGGMIPADTMLEQTTETLVHTASTIRGQGDAINGLRGWFKQRVRVWQELKPMDGAEDMETSSTALSSAKRAKVANSGDSSTDEPFCQRARSWLLERISESSCRDGPLGLQLETAAVITYSLVLLVSQETDKLRRWTVPLINVCKSLDSELFFSIFDDLTEGLLHHFHTEAKKPRVTETEGKQYMERLRSLSIHTRTREEHKSSKYGAKDIVVSAASSSEWYMEKLRFDASSLACLEASQEMWLRFLERESPPTVSILLEWSSRLLLSLGVRITQISDSGSVSSSLMSVQRDVDEALKIVGGLLHTLNKSIIGTSVWKSDTWRYVQVKLLSIIEFSLFLQGTLQWHLYTSNQIALVFVHSVLAFHRITWITKDGNSETGDNVTALIKPLCADIFGQTLEVLPSLEIEPVLLKKPQTNNTKFRSLAARACNGVFPNDLLIQSVCTRSHESPRVFLLDVLYPVIREFTGDVEPLVRSQAFQALHEWIKKVRSLIDSLMRVASSETLKDISTEIVELTLYNWEHPAKHVSNMMQSIFKEVLKMHATVEDKVCSTEANEFADTSYRSSLLKLLVSRRNSRKSKFAALETLCSEWGVLECLNVYPNLLADVLEALGNSANVAGPVSSCWFELLIKARQECEQSLGLKPGSYLGTGSRWQPGKRPKSLPDSEYNRLYQEALSKWRQLWINPFRTTLTSPVRKLRIGCAEYIIPRVLKLDSTCFDELMEHLMAQREVEKSKAVREERDSKGDDGNNLDDRVLWAQLYLIQVARQNSLFSFETSQAILDAAACAIPTDITKLFNSIDVLKLSSVSSLLEACLDHQTETNRLGYGEIVFQGLVHHDIELRMLAFKTISCCGKQNAKVTKSEIALMLVWFLTSTKTPQQEVKHQMTPIVNSFLDRIVHSHREAQKRLEFLEKVQESYLERYGRGTSREEALPELLGNKKQDLVVNVDGEGIDMTKEMAEGIGNSADRNTQWREAAFSAALVQTLGHLLLSGMYTSAPFDKIGVTMALMKELIRRKLQRIK